MFGRIGRYFGLALALLAVAANARGQAPTTVGPIQSQLPEVPRVEAPVQRVPFDPMPPPEPKVEVPVSPNTGMPKLDGDRRYSLADMAPLGNDYIDPRFVINSQRPDDLGVWERVRDGYGGTVHRLISDYKRFYLSENMLYVGIAVAAAAPIANTSADQHIRDAYQNAAPFGKYPHLDNLATGFYQFGLWTYALPAYFGLTGVGYLFPDSPVCTTVGAFGDRSLRALAVGSPMVGVLQYGLGGSRPLDFGSHWQPFHANNTASGHAFVGSIPFLTAASMTDNRLLKVVLIAASFGTAWARIHEDAHYFSQVALGWTIGFLSVEAVNYTEAQRYRVVPIMVPDGFGMGVHVQY